MLGLWFAISGLIFGSLCSITAKKQDRFPKNWFLIGFVSGPIGLILINLLPRLKNELGNESPVLSMDGI